MSKDDPCHPANNCGIDHPTDPIPSTTAGLTARQLEQRNSKSEEKAPVDDDIMIEIDDNVDPDILEEI